MAGKNSTPCNELKKEGTDVILIDMDPARFYEVNCDCVGILKERASDIENKKPHQTRRTNWRKKTTKVRAFEFVQLWFRIIDTHLFKQSQ